MTRWRLCTRCRKGPVKVVSLAVRPTGPSQLTISFTETGALSASAISWALALTLARRVLMVLRASLRLFCLPCLVPPTALPLPHRGPVSLRGYQRSPGGNAYSPGFMGLGERTDMPISPTPSLACGGRTSGEKGGNLKVRGDDAPAEECASLPGRELDAMRPDRCVESSNRSSHERGEEDG